MRACRGPVERRSCPIWRSRCPSRRTAAAPIRSSSGAGCGTRPALRSARATSGRRSSGEYRAETGLAAFRVPIRGADGCSRSRCDLSSGIVVDDAARTITFRLSEPDPDFLYKLALPFGSVVPAGSPPVGTGARPLPATGPYRILRYVPGREVVLVRNPHFRPWSAAAQPGGFPDRIALRLGLDPARQADEISAGNADVMLSSPLPGALGRLSRRVPLQLHSWALPQFDGMFLNTRVAPFDRVAVRRALALAVDRAAIVAHVRRLERRPAGVPDPASGVPRPPAVLSLHLSPECRRRLAGPRSLSRAEPDRGLRDVGHGSRRCDHPQRPGETPGGEVLRRPVERPRLSREPAPLSRTPRVLHGRREREEPRADRGDGLVCRLPGGVHLLPAAADLRRVPAFGEPERLRILRARDRRRRSRARPASRRRIPPPPIPSGGRSTARSRCAGPCFRSSIRSEWISSLGASATTSATRPSGSCSAGSGSGRAPPQRCVRKPRAASML